MQDSHKPHKQYIINKVIGTGSFGRVYQGEYNGNVVAIKIIDNEPYMKH